jgi:hypothetical protein
MKRPKLDVDPGELDRLLSAPNPGFTRFARWKDDVTLVAETRAVADFL